MRNEENFDNDYEIEINNLVDRFESQRRGLNNWLIENEKELEELGAKQGFDLEEVIGAIEDTIADRNEGLEDSLDIDSNIYQAYFS